MFAYDLDFYNDTHDGDTFRIVVEKKFKDAGASSRYGRILAAEYRGKAGTFQTFFWNGKYYDAAGAVERARHAEDAAEVRAGVERVRSQAHAPGAAHRARAPRHRLRSSRRYAGVGRRVGHGHASRTERAAPATS